MKWLSKKDYEKIVVFKKGDKNESLSAVLAFLDEVKVDYAFSDSLYYLFDEGNLSMIYLLKNDAVVFREHLKQFRISVMDSVYHSGIILPQTGTLTLSETYINIYDERRSLLYRIDKRNIYCVADTVPLNTTDILLAAFKSHFREDYKIRLDNVRKNAKQYLGAIDPHFSQPVYSGDTIFSVISFKSENRRPDTLGEKYYSWDSYGSLMIYVPGRFIKMIPLALGDYPFEVNGRTEYYYFSACSFFFWKKKLCIDVMKNELSDDNRLYTQTKIKDGKITIGSMLPIQLPDFNVQNELGYYLLNAVSVKGDLLVFKSLNELYDLNNGQRLYLPVFIAKHEMNKKDIDHLTNKNKSFIIDYSILNEQLHVLYCSNDSLYLSHFRYKNKEIQLSGTEFIVAPYLNSDYGPVLSDHSGSYLFLKNKAQFEFRPYRE